MRNRSRDQKTGQKVKTVFWSSGVKKMMQTLVIKGLSQRTGAEGAAFCCSVVVVNSRGPGDRQKTVFGPLLKPLQNKDLLIRRPEDRQKTENGLLG